MLSRIKCCLNFWKTFERPRANNQVTFARSCNILVEHFTTSNKIWHHHWHSVETIAINIGFWILNESYMQFYSKCNSIHLHCFIFFQKMAEEFKDVCFAKVNVDDNSVCSEIQIIFVCVYSVLTFFLMSVNVDVF